MTSECRFILAGQEPYAFLDARLPREIGLGVGVPGVGAEPAGVIGWRVWVERDIAARFCVDGGSDECGVDGGWIDAADRGDVDGGERV
jgi:hypothetical protein